MTPRRLEPNMTKCCSLVSRLPTLGEPRGEVAVSRRWTDSQLAGDLWAAAAHSPRGKASQQEMDHIKHPPHVLYIFADDFLFTEVFLIIFITLFCIKFILIS